MNDSEKKIKLLYLNIYALWGGHIYLYVKTNAALSNLIFVPLDRFFEYLPDTFK